MRAVLDTNVIVAGLLWNGPPSRLIAAARAGTLTICMSPPLLRELENVLPRRKFRARIAMRGIEAGMLLDGLAELAEWVALGNIPRVVARDPDDDMVVATAVAAKADVIVSGDSDLLSVGSYGGIEIISPAVLAARLRVA